MEHHDLEKWDGKPVWFRLNGPSRLLWIGPKVFWVTLVLFSLSICMHRAISTGILSGVLFDSILKRIG
jgi:hypothetical protein